MLEKRPIKDYENYLIDIEGNVYNIAEFPSTEEAARQLNLDSSTISKVCRGQNKTYGGFVFKYKDN